MDIQEIKTFLAVYRSGSILRAAEAAYMAQTTMSRQLRNLETELGTILFSRSKGQRRLSLTDAGEAFLPCAEEMLRQYEIAMQIGKQKKRLLRFGCANSLANSLIVPLRKQLQSAMPQYELTGVGDSSASILAALDRGELEFGIVLQMQNDLKRDISAVKLGEEEFVLASRVDSNYPETVHVRALKPEKQIWFFGNKQINTWRKELFGEQKPYYYVTLFSGVAQHFAEPDNWAIITRQLYLQDRDQLQLHRADSLPENRGIYLVFRHAPEEKLLATVRQVLLEHLQEIPGIHLLESPT